MQSRNYSFVNTKTSFLMPTAKQLEKVFQRIFDEECNRFTEEGLTALKELKIQQDEIIPRTLEDFQEVSPSEDIAQIRFTHFQQ
mmetsp:Transcript_36847/g.35570  ORF Transcript_36847/g.35570 Transcript_36847/m.35570 type:complete len:84 (+) Transcript_36847:37-288(+)